jgi:hypothetical protein
MPGWACLSSWGCRLLVGAQDMGRAVRVLCCIITACRSPQASSIVITILADLTRRMGPSDCHLGTGPGADRSREAPRPQLANGTLSVPLSFGLGRRLVVHADTSPERHASRGLVPAAQKKRPARRLPSQGRNNARTLPCRAAPSHAAQSLGKPWGLRYAARPAAAVCRFQPYLEVSSSVANPIPSWPSR